MATSLSHQQRVDKHFDARADHWRSLYETQTLEGVIHQRRRKMALDWIGGLELLPGERVLEVGCGAGLVAIELGGRGLDVDCIDTSEAMVELAAAEATEAEVDGRLTVEVGDVHTLAFDSESFDLVIALGVVPFLHAPQAALREMARVARPGAWVLLSSDNKYRLNRVLDPRYAPFPKREAVKQLLTGVGAKPPSKLPTRQYSSKQIKAMIESAGLSVRRYETLGFGPFTLLGRSVLTESPAISLHNRLQARADHGTLGLSRVATQHLILAQKL